MKLFTPPKLSPAWIILLRLQIVDFFEYFFKENENNTIKPLDCLAAISWNWNEFSMDNKHYQYRMLFKTQPCCAFRQCCLFVNTGFGSGFATSGVWGWLHFCQACWSPGSFVLTTINLIESRASCFAGWTWYRYGKRGCCKARWKQSDYPQSKHPCLCDLYSFNIRDF